MDDIVYIEGKKYNLIHKLKCIGNFFNYTGTLLRRASHQLLQISEPMVGFGAETSSLTRKIATLHVDPKLNFLN